MNILLTGGAGYIGSHTSISLTEAGHEVILLDNFCNSQISVVSRLQTILSKDLVCIEGDVRDTALVIKVLKEYQIEAVVHFAGLKAVGESVEKPIEYYANNVQGSISLLEAMKECGVKNLIFSSSATVYGDPQYLPIDENHPTSATNAYGRSKLHIEEMLKDVANSDSAWKIICLRYFNPVGAHKSGLIGENPSGIPNNLMPFISKVASGDLTKLSVFGKDYPTKDGTGIRDYVHVVDLAEGHLAAVSYLDKVFGWDAINLGTGKGHSVMELIKDFELCSSKVIHFEFAPRREGDVAQSYANVDKAFKKLGWRARFSLADMCASAWRWTQKSQ